MSMTTRPRKRAVTIYPPLGHPFIWDAGAGQYRYREGAGTGFVPWRELAATYRKYTTATRRDVRSLSQRYEAGKLERSAWLERVTEVMDLAYSVAAAIFDGGLTGDHFAGSDQTKAWVREKAEQAREWLDSTGPEALAAMEPETRDRLGDLLWDELEVLPAYSAAAKG
jgi:hypothetical protein